MCLCFCLCVFRLNGNRIVGTGVGGEMSDLRSHVLLCFYRPSDPFPVNNRSLFFFLFFFALTDSINQGSFLKAAEFKKRDFIVQI